MVLVKNASALRAETRTPSPEDERIKQERMRQAVVLRKERQEEAQSKTFEEGDEVTVPHGRGRIDGVYEGKDRKTGCFLVRPKNRHHATTYPPSVVEHKAKPQADT
jgi:hypothetical protein